MGEKKEKKQQMNSLEEKILKPISRDEVEKRTLEYFGGDIMTRDQWIRKYALKDSEGNLYEASPHDMHDRIASEISRIEVKYGGENQLSEKYVRSLIDNFKYLIPAGSNMSGIGNDKQLTSLSNCFVIGNTADSYGGIMNLDEQQAQLMKRRGGVGHDLSHIRPMGTDVKNSALTSTGVVPFMERYSNTTKEVAQDGRRGALMLSISIKHPDAERFIDAKMESGKVTNANVSVKIDDEFMYAVKNGTPYKQQYPIDNPDPKFDLEIDARKLWDKIIHNAWKSGEPGILFWDTVTRESVADSYSEEGFKSVSTNPCGEIPLCPYDSCRLLAINLYSYVEDPFTSKAVFNFEKFKKHSYDALRVMDDIVDLEQEKIQAILGKINKDPENEEFKSVERNLWNRIYEKTQEGRRTGIGITAEGDMLAGLGLKYGSEEAIRFSEEVHKAHALNIYSASVDLAKERGHFPIFDFEKEKNNPFIQRLGKEKPELLEEMVKYGRRNISLLTIAPTGTSSMMAQTTSGVEPLFLPAYKRNVKVEVNDKNTEVTFEDDENVKWHTYNVIHKPFKDWLEATGQDPNQLDEINDQNEFNSKVDELVKNSPYFGATSNDVDWVKKVEMQGRIQKWVDHSISATTNMPKGTREEKVRDAYMKAWESGCKGMTVYVEGSRGKGVLNSGRDLESKTLFPSKRPDRINADILRFKNSDENGGEDWIAFVGKIENQPYEIFTGRTEGAMLHIPPKIKGGEIKKVTSEEGSSRYDFIYTNEAGFENVIGGISHQFQREYWNLARLVSGHLREGTPLPNLVKIVKKLDDGEENINSWKNGVLRALKKSIPDETDSGEVCNECKSPIIFQNGCETCGCGEKCG